MSVKTQFSIRDLENLSGVKAHTIRIWEKRYRLLKPERTETNIRYYDLNSLKRLLNVSFLYKDGYKISRIAELDESEIKSLIKEKSELNQDVYALNAFKTAMFDFDEQLFSKTYLELSLKKSFKEIFHEVFIPLLSEIGTLWQTSTIDPCHESFISELVKRKVIINIDLQIQNFKKSGDMQFALFLPYSEIHEIGLLFCHFEILSAGFNAIYLGANIPLESLKNLKQKDPDITFVSYVTMHPEGKSIYDYISEYKAQLCDEKICNLWLLGSKVQQIDLESIPSEVMIIPSLEQLSLKLNTLKKY
ncbi:MerR family transcriptional regulator [Ulvibacter antarcticus]|uniref:DNA-binding transcriptional MerR regulator n=1 Tax=Ulvibacter antarcticus TaxID=442714 RepID=A0A3L9YNM9_9FLAO|nr:MerR family transcriptional regulator [Ulvibacter antarcticus]RMA56262.1 DNA-binding transcriptional MerR regulator [Ulvibacter antarcticus]